MSVNQEQVAAALRAVLLEYSDSPGVLNTSATLSAVEEVDITKVGGASLSLGQQLAAASVPMVMTAAQLTTLTPLTTLPTVTTVTTVSAVTSITNALPVGANVIGKVGIDQTTPGTTNFVQNKQMPDATATFAPTSVVSAGLEASGVIKASAGTLYGFSGYSALAAGQFILLFDSETVPVDTTVPDFSPIVVNANGNWSVDFGEYGKHFSAGISWSNSSTAATKTIGAADCFIDAELK